MYSDCCAKCGNTVMDSCSFIIGLINEQVKYHLYCVDYDRCIKFNKFCVMDTYKYKNGTRFFECDINKFINETFCCVCYKSHYILDRSHDKDLIVCDKNNNRTILHHECAKYINIDDSGDMYEFCGIKTSALFIDEEHKIDKQVLKDEKKCLICGAKVIRKNQIYYLIKENNYDICCKYCYNWLYFPQCKKKILDDSRYIGINFNNGKFDYVTQIKKERELCPICNKYLFEYIDKTVCYINDNKYVICHKKCLKKSWKKFIGIFIGILPCDKYNKNIKLWKELCEDDKKCAIRKFNKLK